MRRLMCLLRGHALELVAAPLTVALPLALRCRRCGCGVGLGP